MNPNTAIQFGQLVQAAYAVDPSDLKQAAGSAIPAQLDPFGMTYTVVTTIYGNDLATDINPTGDKQVVSFGYVLQDQSGDAVIAIRGTQGIWEWVHDAAFLYVPCPFPGGAGNTEDGFTAIYKSLSIDAQLQNKLVASLDTLQFNRPVNSVTICGHSLGGALATLTSVDVAANSKFTSPTSYTYASPRTGDPFFAAKYNQLVPNTFRIANRSDLVPKLPLPPMYEHVAGLIDLNPIGGGSPLVNDTISCEHILTTYLYLLAKLPGVPLKLQQQLQLSAACQPKGLPTALC